MSRPISLVFILTYFLLCIVIILEIGCERKARQPAVEPVGEYAVRDFFETGRNVFVRAVRPDGDQLWVGTSTGVIQVNRKTGDLIRTYTTQDGLRSNYIFTIHVDPAGAKWFGTDAGGLSRYDGQTWRTYMPEDGLADEWVYDIAFAGDGKMWIATWDGANLYDGNEFLTYRVQDGLVNKWVYSIAVDIDGAIWMGTEEGVNRFDGKKWETYRHEDGLGAPNEMNLPGMKTSGQKYEESQKNIQLAPGRSYEGHFHDLTIFDAQGRETYNADYVFSIVIDSEGTKWFGSWGGGVSRYDGKTWTHYTTKDGLAGNIVYALEFDRHGRLWAGTNHGVSVFDGKSWRSYKKDQGLYGEDAYAIAPDADDNLWIGHKGGVTLLGAEG
jgi:ligand-binding sensor domain-containing protein